MGCPDIRRSAMVRRSTTRPMRRAAALCRSPDRGPQAAPAALTGTPPPSRRLSPSAIENSACTSELPYRPRGCRPDGLCGGDRGRRRWSERRRNRRSAPSRTVVRHYAAAMRPNMSSPPIRCVIRCCADQRSRRGAVKLRKTYDMRAARDCGHCRRIAESTAERHGAKQHRIGRVESDAAGDVERMPRDGLLIVQNQFWSAGRTRSREGKARRFRRCRVRPRFGGGHSSGNTGKSASSVTPVGARIASTQRKCARSSIAQACEDRRKIDRRKIPIRHQSCSPRAAEQITNFRRAKARIDVHGKRAEPRASKDRRQITGAIRQPQRHARAGADAGLAKPGRRTQHASGETLADQVCPWRR